MIQLNIIPIVMYQEKEADAVKYFKNTKDYNVRHIPFARTTTKLQDLLGITNASLFNHAEAMIKTDLLYLMTGPKRRSFVIPLHVDRPLAKFGVVFIENGVVKREIIFEKLYKRIDFGLFLNDTSSNSSFDAQILHYFKDLDLKEKVSIISNSIIEESEKSNQLVDKVLQSDLGRFYFKGFATSEFSVENIMFYEEVMNFKNMKKAKSYDVENQIQRAEEMIETYLKPSSIMQLNTTDEFLQNVSNSFEVIKKGNVDEIDKLFDEVLGDTKVVLSDTYSRFVFSRYFSEYQKSLNSTNQSINYLI
jgi:hypothetical protein